MPYVENVKKLCITYICTGKYNLFFYDFYRTFNENFCPGHELTFAIITDKPEICNNIKNVKVYDIQRHYKNKDVNFIKFRKWKDILLCEDLLINQDYCFFINSNLVCKNVVTLEDLFKGKSQYAVYHSLFGIQSMPMYEALCKHPKSAAFFDAQNRLKYPICHLRKSRFHCHREIRCTCQAFSDLSQIGGSNLQCSASANRYNRQG